MVQGIDVAAGQHAKNAAISWTKVAASGYKFAFVKVTEGTYYVNPYYLNDAGGAQAAGLFVAPYAFGIPNYSGGTLQADYALDRAGSAGGRRMLPLILDIEYDPYAGRDGTRSGTWCYGLSASQMVAWIAAFVSEAERRTGQQPAIYTTAQWWNECTGGSARFAADPLWIADYPADPSSLPSGPAPAAGWRSWTYWQYSSSAALPSAISGVFDVSYLSRSALELAAVASQSDGAGSAASVPVNTLTGGSPPAFSATGLPPGIAVGSSTGVASGRLGGRAASFPVVVTATSGATHAARTFSWYVHAKASLGKPGRRTATVARPVRYQVPAADGLPGCTLRLTAAGLPPGLAMNSCGKVTGFPATSGTYPVRISASDSSGAVLARRSFSWRVRPANGRGPSGPIRLRRAGKCLAALGISDIAIEPCGAAHDEVWTVAADDSIRSNGRCLTAQAAGRGPAALHLGACSGAGQRWQLRSDGVLTDPGGRCLAGSGTANGARATAAVCAATSNSTGSASTPSSSQQWTLPAGLLTSGVAGYCANGERPSGASSGAVTLQRCHPSAPQAWAAEPDGAISAGGSCLGTAGGSVAPGARLGLVRCVAGAASQVWQLSGGPFGVELVSPVAGLCAADPGDRSAAGTALVLGPCVATDAGTRWRIS